MWFKVDDGFAFHQKTVEAGNAAVGLWLRAGSWSSQLGTDGHIPEAIRKSLGNPRETQRLLAVGLWTPDPSGSGYLFHDWADYQPTREGSEERHRARIEAGRRGGIASGKARRQLKAVVDE